MDKTIGIRREDKNEWERRVPLIPEHVANLQESGLTTYVQPSDLRIYSEQEYADSGAVISEDLSPAKTIFAVKEIPIEFYEQGKTYIFFSHVIKGQSYNMGMLRHMMNLGVNLIDYERIVDEHNRRLIFFGRYAGLAGMIESLFAYQQKLEAAGNTSPLAGIKQAYEYGSIDAALDHMKEIGEKISGDGFPELVGPVVIGFAGYGNVSKGAQEVLDHFPVIEVTPAELLSKYATFENNNVVYKVVFSEEDMVRPLAGDFELNDYYNHPEKYISRFEQYVPYLTLLMNCIYWTDKYPRLITKQFLQDETDTNLKLKVVGDISCDIDGAIQFTHKVTYPDAATFTYFPAADSANDGTAADGITVMAIDNLPCEFSRESSAEFSIVLKDFVKDIVAADFSVAFDQLDLPQSIKSALILHNGKLTSDYTYLEKFIEGKDE